MIALLIGTLYFGIGEDAQHALNIFRYIFFSIMFLMFTGMWRMDFSFDDFFCLIKKNFFRFMHERSIQFGYISLWVYQEILMCDIAYASR